MPEREFDLYLSVLSRLLRLNPQQKDAIADELRDHLEERFEELVRSGVPRDDAIRRALDEFGDAAGLAVDFTAVSKKRIRRLIMRSTAAITALIALVAFFLADVAPQQPGVPALPGPAVASAQSEKPQTTDSAPADETKEPAPLPPLARISGPPLLPQTLSEWTHMSFVDVPLVDVAEFISNLHAFPVVLDSSALEDAGINGSLPITFHIADPPAVEEAISKGDLTPEQLHKLREKHAEEMVPLHQALTWMLRPHDLSWFVEDEVLHITTVDGELQHWLVRSYSIRSLLKSGIASDALAHTIMTMTNGDWQEPDGMGGTLSVVGQVLTVQHSYQMHRRVESLLASLSQHSPWHYVDYPARHIRQLELLEQPVGQLEFVDTPLVDVVEYMSQVIGAPIQLDMKALEEEGLSSDVPVSLRLADRPLRTAMKLILKPLQLNILVQDGVLTVTTYTVESDNRAMHTVVYDVRDIEASANPDGSTQTRLEALVEAIQNTTDYWFEIDGDGGDLCIPGGGRLVIRHSDTEHRQIRELLAAHRRLLGEDEGGFAMPSNSLVETRFYRVPAEAAEDLLVTIPQMVAEESWNRPQIPVDPQTVGAIRKVAVGSRVIETGSNSPDDDSKDGKPGNQKSRTQRTVLKESVLIIRNTRAVHAEIDDLLHNLGLKVRGELPSRVPSTGGGFF